MRQVRDISKTLQHVAVVQVCQNLRGTAEDLSVEAEVLGQLAAEQVVHASVLEVREEWAQLAHVDSLEEHLQDLDSDTKICLPLSHNTHN